METWSQRLASQGHVFTMNQPKAKCQAKHDPTGLSPVELILRLASIFGWW